MGGKYASQYCKNLVGRFFCMETFPPCYSSSQYAVYPCRKTCDVLESYCHQYTPVDCPRDGPYMNATEVRKLELITIVIMNCKAVFNWIKL